MRIVKARLGLRVLRPRRSPFHSSQRDIPQGGPGVPGGYAERFHRLLLRPDVEGALRRGQFDDLIAVEPGFDFAGRGPQARSLAKQCGRFFGNKKPI